MELIRTLLQRSKIVEMASRYDSMHKSCHMQDTKLDQFMFFDDLEPGVVLQVLLYLDSPTAFRIRRCNRDLAKLIDNGGFKLWRDLLKGTPVSPGSHTTKGGIWLHALVPEDVLSLYVRFCSATKLANDLRFKDMTAVAGLQKVSRMSKGISMKEDPVEVAEDAGGNAQPLKIGYVTRHGRPIHLKGPLLGPFVDAFMSRGQQFLGSWTFNTQRVRAMLSAKEPGPVYSSCVEFHAMLSCRNGFEGQMGVLSQDRIDFGVQLMLSRVAAGRIALSWQPCVKTVGISEEHINRYSVHLHGHTAVPFTFPLGYEGPISTLSPARMHITGNLPSELILSSDEIAEMLEQDCLNCTLNIQLYDEQHALRVNANTGCCPHAQTNPWCTKSSSWANKLHDLWYQQRLSPESFQLPN